MFVQTISPLLAIVDSVLLKARCMCIVNIIKNACISNVHNGQ